MGYSLRLAATDFIYAIINRIVHTTICGALTGTRTSSDGAPGGIDPTTHCGRSTMEVRSASSSVLNWEPVSGRDPNLYR